jgi:GNAT superfamily N-acetyltransferase
VYVVELAPFRVHAKPRGMKQGGFQADCRFREDSWSSCLLENQPVGWCAVAPREAFQRLERSRVLKRVDDNPVWSVVCFFIAKSFRRKGISVKLLKAAVDYATKEDAKIVEGYPIEPKKPRTPDASVYTGLASVFRRWNLWRLFAVQKLALL